MKSIIKIKVFCAISIMLLSLVLPVIGNIEQVQPSTEKPLIIAPTSFTLSYVEDNGGEFEVLGWVHGEWSDPSSGPTLVWGELPMIGSGTYNGHGWVTYREANYGLWLNRLKVKWGFSDIPSGYERYRVCLYYVGGSADEYSTVTWDGDDIDAELIDSGWYCTRDSIPGVCEYDISYDDSGYIIYQDYTSYYQCMDWIRSDIRLSVPFIYAYES
ncbi:hypothetical protein EU527_04560 [Candidatus Thorarchaeota archaeon]|nr:MAG: hypothetical protein EU527_04560 [Candidatus Thorarchaeota archaeon]